MRCRASKAHAADVTGMNSRSAKVTYTRGDVPSRCWKLIHNIGPRITRDSEYTYAIQYIVRFIVSAAQNITRARHAAWWSVSILAEIAGDAAHARADFYSVNAMPSRE
jgi:hypothetical protein